MSAGRARACRRKKSLLSQIGLSSDTPSGLPALASVINVLDPDVIVLGGGMSNVGRLYTEVPQLWKRYVFSDHVATWLAAPAHGDSSGVRGAAALGLTWRRKKMHTSMDVLSDGLFRSGGTGGAGENQVPVRLP